MFQVFTFAKIRIDQARSESAVGHPDQAAKILLEVSAFGGRMADGRNTDVERSAGLNVSRQALRELHTLYTTEGRTEEARAAALQLQKIDSLRKDLSLHLRADVYDPSALATRPLLCNVPQFS